tara:strand:- start:3171 stop:3749 length:579 start_codon:yes stop_codon:yes gene_type:complete
MKLRGIVFYLILFVNGFLYSQKDTIWFDGDWKAQAKDSSVYYRVSEHKEIRFVDNYYFTDYFIDGLKLKKGMSLKEKSDKFEGEVIYYREGVYVSERILYRNGSAYGEHRIYYNSGKLESIKNYDFGVLQGLSKVYFEDGVLKETGIYTNNERNDEWKVYYPNGKLKEQGHYKEGNRIGVWKVYYYNGISQK